MFTRARNRIREKWAQFGLLSFELIAITIGFFGSVIVFVVVAKAIFFDQKKQFDQDVFDGIRPMITPGMTDAMQVITFFAKHDFLIPANLLLLAYFLFIKKHRWYSIKVPAIALSSTGLLFLMKSYFGRQRPDPPLVEAALGLSFPSGHAMMSFVFYGLLIYLTHKYVRNNDPLKWSIIVFLLLFIFVIGFSRIYLRVHYASDVIAGFCVGFVWLVFSIWLIDKIEKKTRRTLAAPQPVAPDP